MIFLNLLEETPKQFDDLAQTKNRQIQTQNDLQLVNVKDTIQSDSWQMKYFNAYEETPKQLSKPENNPIKLKCFNT